MEVGLRVPGALYITYFAPYSAYSVFSRVKGMESYRWLGVTCCGSWFHRLLVYFKLSFTGAFLQFHWKPSWLLTNYRRTQIFHLFICLCCILMLHFKSKRQILGALLNFELAINCQLHIMLIT